MKNFLRIMTIALTNLIFLLNTEAQEKFIEGKQTMGDRTFEIRISKINPERMWVTTRLPQYKNGYPLPETPTPPMPLQKGDLNVDTTTEKTIIHQVLKHKLEKLKKNNEQITIHYVFGQDGNIVDIESFSFPKNTLITPKELYMIDKRLRKDVKATFKGREYLEHPVIFYGREIWF
ncbi:hypothetical protein ACFOET_11010 [Parapedobacter deserti]|uniref:TonB C-terminal domain-containing protein n=1 Tax=Parapedobacter deserti TaxID=1912957 RepID=A0ABV7JJA4_9SPHI